VSPHPLPDFGPWPDLEWEHWKDTADTLHMFMQIVGKTRLALTPLQNHWWNVPFYLTARGLSTSPMPAPNGRLIDAEFDFLAHEVVFRTSLGEVRKIALSARPVAEFFREFFAALAALGVQVAIDPEPVEVANPIRCDLDTLHCSYDKDAAWRFWRVLVIADTLLKRFSTNFYGKISPVHFFWGSFDLAVTRFSGRKAPPRPGADRIQAEAYSHEVISAGFWPGNGGYGRAAFYAYAAPVPEGLNKAVLQGKGAFNQTLGEFLLDYSDAQKTADPSAAVLRFLQETYSAAADAAHRDRASLDRDVSILQCPDSLNIWQRRFERARLEPCRKGCKMSAALAAEGCPFGRSAGNRYEGHHTSQGGWPEAMAGRPSAGGKQFPPPNLGAPDPSAARVAPASQPAVAWASLPTLTLRQHFHGRGRRTAPCLTAFAFYVGSAFAFRIAHSPSPRASS